jgi:hypothetical protein
MIEPRANNAVQANFDFALSANPLGLHRANGHREFTLEPDLPLTWQIRALAREIQLEYEPFDGVWVATSDSGLQGRPAIDLVPVLWS